MIDETAKRDPFADFMRALQGHDAVIVRLEGVGETAYSTKEVYEMIDFRITNLQAQLETKETLLQLQEITMSMLSDDKAMLVRQLAESQRREEAATKIIQRASKECNHWDCPVKKWRGPQEAEK